MAERRRRRIGFVAVLALVSAAFALVTAGGGADMVWDPVTATFQAIGAPARDIIGTVIL